MRYTLDKLNKNVLSYLFKVTKYIKQTNLFGKSIDKLKQTTYNKDNKNKQPQQTAQQGKEDFMKAETYFKKNNVIYGISWKYSFGWHYYTVKFDNLDDAYDWLHKEEGDFRERELCSKTRLIKVDGRQAPAHCDTYCNGQLYPAYF